MLFFSFSCIAILCCHQKATHFEKTNNIDTTPIFTIDKKLEQKIIDTVFSLPEVKKDQDHSNKKTREKRDIQVIIYKTPKETNQNNYWIKVGEDNGSAFVSHFNFYIYLMPFTIKYLDTQKNKAISLSEWRRHKKK